MNLNCSTCGAELLSNASFCRQCGVAVSDTESQSEQATAIFPHDTGLETQRLDPRATGEPNVTSHFPRTTLPSSNQPRQTLRWSVVAAILSVLLICIIGGAWLVLMRGNDRRANSGLMYPGAKTVVDMRNNDGSRALHLETDASLSEVENWYSTNLKLEKTIRLTEGSVVLKSENEAITLVNENNKTSILIKMAQ
jgi:hypothetical protein